MLTIKLFTVMIKRIILLLGLIVIFWGCEKDDSGTVYKKVYVASRKLDLGQWASFMPNPCLMIRENPDYKWQPCNTDILGFDYEEGYEYILEIKVVPAKLPPDVHIDGAPFSRHLIRQISKEKRTSENMPADYPPL